MSSETQTQKIEPAGSFDATTAESPVIIISSDAAAGGDSFSPTEVRPDRIVNIVPPAARVSIALGLLASLGLGGLEGLGGLGRVRSKAVRGRTCPGCKNRIEKASWPCRNIQCPEYMKR